LNILAPHVVADRVPRLIQNHHGWLSRTKAVSGLTLIESVLEMNDRDRNRVGPLGHDWRLIWDSANFGSFLNVIRSVRGTARGCWLVARSVLLLLVVVPPSVLISLSSFDDGIDNQMAALCLRDHVVASPATERRIRFAVSPQTTNNGAHATSSGKAAEAVAAPIDLFCAGWIDHFARVVRTNGDYYCHLFAGIDCFASIVPAVRTTNDDDDMYLLAKRASLLVAHSLTHARLLLLPPFLFF
jgi:hypothetical protein